MTPDGLSPENTKQNDSTKSYRYILVGLVLVVLLLVIWFGPESIPFLDFSTEDVIRLITSAILIALFIERTTEVILSAWRGKKRRETAQRLDIETRTAKAQGMDENKMATIENYRKETANMEKLRAENQRIALITALALGIFISALGVRLIQPLLDPRVIDEMARTQYRFLAGLDVLITGALLGGGANGLHRVLDLFLTAVDRKRGELKKESPTSGQ